MFSQTLLDQISHADTDRVARALEALQQHTMAVALLYTSDTTITAEVTSIKVKRNRQKEARIERDPIARDTVALGVRGGWCFECVV